MLASNPTYGEEEDDSGEDSSGAAVARQSTASDLSSLVTSMTPASVPTGMSSLTCTVLQPW